MDETIIQVLKSLDSGGCIYRYDDHAEVNPIYSGCAWTAYNIDLDLFWEMYVGGLITEHYDPQTFQFVFYDITPAGDRYLHPIKREGWETDRRWSAIQ